MFIKMLAKSYLDAKSRVYDSNYRSAERAAYENAISGKVEPPSWLNDDKKSEQFINDVLGVIHAKGISTDVLKFLNSDRSFSISIFSIAAHMEKSGASFTEQRMAAADIGLKVAKLAIKKFESGQLSSS